MVEDRRVYDGAVLTSATGHPSPIVRRHAALAIGRIGDRTGTTHLLQLLEDVDDAVRQDAAFALGLMKDPSGFDPLRTLVLRAAPEAQGPKHAEAVAAIAKIGGRDAAQFYEELLSRWVGSVVAGAEAPPSIERALAEAWRFHGDAPVRLLVQFAEAPIASVRIAAIYSLAIIHARDASTVFLRAANDRDSEVRAFAASALTASYVDSAGVDRGAAAQWLMRLIQDSNRNVRINALRSLGTYRDPSFARPVIELLSESDQNVRVQALTTLGQLKGIDAARALLEHVKRGLFAVRRAALLGLARADRDEGIRYAAAWIIDDDWLRRFAGIDALNILGGDTATAWLEDLTKDPDGRVAAHAFTAFARHDSSFAQELARDLVQHSDPAVRAAAAGHMRMAPRRSDVDLLLRAYSKSVDDPTSVARLSIVNALAVVANLGFAARSAVEDRFVAVYAQNVDYVVRRAAIERLPSAAAQWGSVTPIETGRSLADYREIARRLIIPAEERGELPEIELDTERGTVTVALFAADAPIAVHAFLQLVDRNYFDGSLWYGVIPGVSIQGGDPRGDGFGGPGFYLRGELNRQRFERGTVGLVQTAPDTAHSLFIITVGPEASLEGTYPVIGSVRAGMDVVERLMEGDRIVSAQRR